MKIQTLAALFIATLSFTTFAYAKPTTTKLPSLASQFSKPLAFDTIPAEEGDIKITPVFHGSIQIEYDGKVILIDPIGAGSYPKEADVVLITHSHPDHLDFEAVSKATNRHTVVFASNSAAYVLKPLEISKDLDVEGMTDGAFFGGQFGGTEIEIQAVPAYNLVRGPKSGAKFGVAPI